MNVDLAGELSILTVYNPISGICYVELIAGAPHIIRGSPV